MDLKILSLTSSAKLAQIGEKHKGFIVLSLQEVIIFAELLYLTIMYPLNANIANFVGLRKIADVPPMCEEDLRKSIGLTSMLPVVNIVL